MIFGWGKLSTSAIRPLRREKAAECARLHQLSFAHSWSKAEIETMLASAATIGAAALDPASGKLRGFVISRLAGDEAEILTVAVAPALRGKGVGRAMLREHFKQAANAGALAIFLEVEEGNAPAIALYRRYGFAEVGKRAGYYHRPGGPPLSALVMRKDFTRDRP